MFGINLRPKVHLQYFTIRFMMYNQLTYLQLHYYHKDLNNLIDSNKIFLELLFTN